MAYRVMLSDAYNTLSKLLVASEALREAGLEKTAIFIDRQVAILHQYLEERNP